jgi:hypothetical protein
MSSIITSSAKHTLRLVKLHRPTVACGLFVTLLDRRNTFFQNIYKILPDYIASQLRRQHRSSYSRFININNTSDLTKQTCILDFRVLSVPFTDHTVLFWFSSHKNRHNKIILRYHGNMKLRFYSKVQIDMVGKRLALQKRTIIIRIYIERI